jgi:hypothetical protein
LIESCASTTQAPTLDGVSTRIWRARKLELLMCKGELEGTVYVDGPGGILRFTDPLKPRVIFYHGMKFI